MAWYSKRKPLAVLHHVPQSQAAIIEPTVFRHQHGRIKRLAWEIDDALDAPGRPFHAMGLLENLVRQGQITSEMWEAANVFRGDFDKSVAMRLRASDPSLIAIRGTAGRVWLDSQLTARTRMDKALNALGGSSSPPQDCAWFVLGQGLTLREYAQRQRWGKSAISDARAKDLLIQALQILVEHYRKVRRRDFSSSNDGKQLDFFHQLRRK